MVRHCLNTMKKANIIKGVIFFSVLTLISGSIFMAQAASNGSFENKFNRGQALTDEERADREAVREARRAEMENHWTAVQTALDNGDYQAWLTAIGDNNPFADKINESNFPRFLEAHRLMKQAGDIMTELGIERVGFGPGEHFRGSGMGNFMMR